MMTLINHNNKTIYIIEVKKDIMLHIYLGTINLQTTVIDENHRDLHSLFKIDYKIIILCLILNNNNNN